MHVRGRVLVRALVLGIVHVRANHPPGSGLDPSFYHFDAGSDSEPGSAGLDHADSDSGPDSAGPNFGRGCRPDYHSDLAARDDRGPDPAPGQL